MDFKKIIIALILVSIAANVSARKIESRVSDVVLYSQGAMVTRTTNVELNAGDHNLVLTGFPSEIRSDQLQVEVTGSDVRIGQVRLKEHKTRNAQNEEINELDEKIANVKLDMSIVEDSNKSANLQLKFLDSLASGYAKQAWVGSAQASADTVSWERALSLMQTGSANSYKVIRDNLTKMSELKKDLNLLNRQRSAKLGAELENSQVIVNVATETPSSAEIKVHYYQDDAAWFSTYEARLNSETGKLQLTQKAVIEQNTPEPWVQANIVLSTSQPSAEMRAPEVSSVFLNLIDRQTSYASAPSNSDGSGMLEEVIVTASKVKDSWSGSYSLNYPIAGLVTVNNDADQEQQYDLQKFEFNASLVTQIVPRESTQAYLAARFTNDGNTPLYTSEMLVYVDSVLMGEATMPNILPGSEVTLPMGQDRRIEVKVVDRGGVGGDGGIIKKQRKEVTDLVFEITNRRSVSSSIEVRDAYPVSKNRAVKVAIIDGATPPTEPNENDKAGVAVWRKQLGSGETWKINFGYSVTHPAEREVRQSY